ncbi:MAG: alpha/beta hydrolase [Caldilineae bacterium]|nr:MAG: alpha/beta hydrolase [Caldilineae bacterium]
MHYTVSPRRGRAQVGPVLALVHGAGESLLHWPPELRRLPGATVYALDLPGHGKSTGPALRTIEEYAASVWDFLQAQGVERPVLAGHSMGGAIVLACALAHPQDVAGLILVGTGARLPVSPRLLAGLREDFPATCRRIVGWAYGPLADEALRARALEQMLAVDPEVLYNDFVACSQFDVTARLGEITAPCLVVCGAADKMTPPALSEELAAGLPNSRLELVPDAGHMLPLERPARLMALIEDVKRLWTHG